MPSQAVLVGTTALSINIGHNRAEAGATQINNVTNNFASASEQQIDRVCLETLRCPDSRRVKNRLKNTKDELLRDSYKWILSNEQYCRWRHGDDLSLLWIKGGAGKGKTMISIGLTEELCQNEGKDLTVIYFFCQNADYELNTVATVLKGLIFRLIERHHTLMKALRKNWDEQKSGFIVDIQEWPALWDILLEMLDDYGAVGGRVFIVVDALDECHTGHLNEFVRTLMRTGLERPKQVKWLLTSRPLGEAEHELAKGAKRTHVSLELNADQVDRGIQNYINHRVQKLALVHEYSAITTQMINEAIRVGANGAFLWASLVCDQLETVPASEAVSMVRETPPELERLYDQAYQKLCTGPGPDVSKCLHLLQALLLAYRPLRISELVSMFMPGESQLVCKNLVDQCSTFIRVRHESRAELVEFVHQSARDYLAETHDSHLSNIDILPSHGWMATRSLSHLIDHLYTNLLRCPDPNVQREELLMRGFESLLSLSYAAEFWIDHLCAALEVSTYLQVLPSREMIGKFLLDCFLEWLECMSLLHQLPRAVEGFEKLLNTANKADELTRKSLCPHLVQDACRFLRRHYQMIFIEPLQVYISAVFFTPESSLTRRANIWRFPQWLRDTPSLEQRWSSLQQTLKAHQQAVHSVAFSPDGQLIVSGGDNQIKFWNVRTGLSLQQCNTFTSVSQLSFSPDGHQLAYHNKSKDTVETMNVETGQVIIQHRLSKNVEVKMASVDISIKSRVFASYDPPDNAIVIQDLDSGHVLWRLKGHINFVHLLVFSADGRLLASGSEDLTIKLWDVQTGYLQQIFEPALDPVSCMALSPDGLQLAFAYDRAKVSNIETSSINIWDTKTGVVLQTLRTGNPWRTIEALDFSHSGHMIASRHSHSIQLWDVHTGTELQTLFAFDVGRACSLAFSPNGQLIASGGGDGSVKIWEVGTNHLQQVKNARHWGAVSMIKLNTKDQEIETYFEASYGGQKRIWDLRTQEYLRYTYVFKNRLSSLRSSFSKLKRYTSHPAGVSQSLHIKDQWLLCGSKRILKFPSEYVPSCYDQEGDLIAIGFENGDWHHFVVNRTVLAGDCAAYTGIPCSARRSSIPAD